jgi:hypothetical protein
MPGNAFLNGPVPWPWLRKAMALPGKAVAVGLTLWLQAGITGKRIVRLCLARAVDNGIPIHTARRAVQQLEATRLVRVVRKPGPGLEVTILDANSE